MTGAFPALGGRIEVRVAETAQLFDPMDPSPRGEKDLNTTAHQFIVDSARELPRGSAYELRVFITNADSDADVSLLKEAISRHFVTRADVARRQLRHLFQLGRRSMGIGIVFLALVLTLGEVIQNLAGDSQAVRLLGESLTIGGWVAMWRPLEIFLYDWWPIRNDIRLLDALGAAPIEIVYGEAGRRTQ